MVELIMYYDLSDALLTQLKKRMLEAGESEPTITPAPERPSQQRSVKESEIPIF